MAINVEEAIQEAQRDGRFSKLPGQGKPLEIDPSPDVVIKNLLKNAHVRPEWIEVGCEIDALQQQSARHLELYARQHAAAFEALTQSISKEQTQSHSLLNTLCRWWHILWRGHEHRSRRGDPVASFNRDWNVALARQAALLHQINARIRRYNYLVPARECQMCPIFIKEKLEAFISQFPQVTPSMDGAVTPCRGAIPPHLLNAPVQNSTSTPCDIVGQRLLDSRHRSA